MDSERFVRDHWESVEVWQPWLDLAGDPSYEVILGARGYPNIKAGGDYEEGMWNEAAEFTRERIEEIRQLECAKDYMGDALTLSFINDWIIGCGHPEFCDEDAEAVRITVIEHVRHTRVLTCLQSTLAELRRGMKCEADHE